MQRTCMQQAQDNGHISVPAPAAAATQTGLGITLTVALLACADNIGIEAAQPYNWAQ